MIDKSIRLMPGRIKPMPREWGLEQAIQAPVWSDQMWLTALATLGLRLHSSTRASSTHTLSTGHVISPLI